MQVSQVYTNLLDETVKDWVSKKAIFTAYDITVSTRKKHGIELKHTWVRDLIHKLPAIVDALEYKEYERSVCNIFQCDCGNKFIENDDGADEDECPVCSSVAVSKIGQVIVYHHSSNHVSNYVFDSENIEKNNLDEFNPLRSVIDKLHKSRNHCFDKDGNVAPVPVVPAAPVGKSSLVASLDYRNRLELPFEILQIIGLEPKQDAFIVPVKDSGVNIFKSNEDAGNAEFICTQKLSIDGKLLLPNRILKMAGLTGKDFQIENSVKDGIALVEIKPVN